MEECLSAGSLSIPTNRLAVIYKHCFMLTSLVFIFLYCNILMEFLCLSPTSPQLEIRGRKSRWEREKMQFKKQGAFELMIFFSRSRSTVISCQVVEFICGSTKIPFLILKKLNLENFSFK